jgi:hypothetical protein
MEKRKETGPAYALKTSDPIQKKNLRWN